MEPTPEKPGGGAGVPGQPTRPAALRASIISTGDSPLSREQIQQISNAKRELAPILKCQKVAQRTAGGLISGGVLTALLAFMGGLSITALIMGLWMMVAGGIEYWQAQKIHRLKPQALLILTRNQLLLGSMFVVLGLWWMLEVKMGWGTSAADKKEMNSLISALSGPGVGAGASQVKSIITTVEYVAYGAIVLFGLLCQGWLSIYYAHRRGLLKTYLAHTPDWIISLQKHDTL